MDYKKVQPIQELYTCLQGEGKLTGIPHILIRTTGCVLRCQFSNTDFCDSWYTSWHPKKGVISLEVIEQFFKDNSHINHTMITGGSPTMHPELLQELCLLAKSYGHYITIETEGSKFVPTCADMISLSPKFKNSKPRVGTTTPLGVTVTGRDITKHEKHRKNWKAMKQLIDYHNDFQIKPVISTLEEKGELKELTNLMEFLQVTNKEVWLMPAGGTNTELNLRRVELIEYCIMKGYNYTDRLHIVAYNDKIGV